MKSLLLIFALLFSTQFLFSQTVDGRSISEIDATYIAMKVYCGRYNSFTLRIDYGQRVESPNRRDSNQIVRGENGAPSYSILQWTHLTLWLTTDIFIWILQVLAH